MKLLDARRLTGLNVLWERPCAVVDIEVESQEIAQKLSVLWQKYVHEVLTVVGWSAEKTTSHTFVGGISFALSAPIDCLYSAVEITEWAFQQCETDMHPDRSEEQPESLADFIVRVQLLIKDEQNPAVLALAQEAQMRNVAFLWDDDFVSIGYGQGSKTWPVSEIPDHIDWTEIRNIPIALVTGTNGKTTTVRLTSHILQAAGHSVGISSTDWIGVNNEIIDRGDYSGPGGARTILRQQTIDHAILETARGGLLRRGLGVQRADVALITNISEDHLGDYGSRNLEELESIKWLVMQALDSNSVAVLNADDPYLLEKSKTLQAPELFWFSLNPESPLIQQQMQNGIRLVSVIDNKIARFDGENWHTLCDIKSIPLTMNGIATHNVSNALAAVSLSVALGIPDVAIIQGLQSMTANENPGRCNLFKINNCEVLLDFAHNPEGMASIFKIAQKHPAKRRFLCFGQAGDRTDEMIQKLAHKAWDIGLEHVFIAELENYLRGRENSEVYNLLRNELIRVGARADQVTHTQQESESLQLALDMATEGDLIILLALSESKNLLQYLNTIGTLVA